MRYTVPIVGISRNNEYTRAGRTKNFARFRYTAGVKRTKIKRPGVPTVKLVHPSYQPTKAELEEDLRVDATFEEIAKAVTRTVNIEYYKPERKRR